MSIIARTTSVGSGGPTPEAWDRIRFRCISRISDSGMRWRESDPNPVFTP